MEFRLSRRRNLFTIALNAISRSNSALSTDGSSMIQVKRNGGRTYRRSLTKFGGEPAKSVRTATHIERAGFVAGTLGATLKVGIDAVMGRMSYNQIITDVELSTYGMGGGVPDDTQMTALA